MPHRHHVKRLETRRTANRGRLWGALAINAVVLAATVAGGILADSLALLAEAGHLLSDVGAIAIALFASSLAARAPTPSRTFGLQRSEVLAALVNGVALVVIAVLIVVAAISRFSGTPDVAGGGVLALGVVGLLGNIAATALLAAGERSDLNLEGALRHSAADALGSLGVIVAGTVVLATGWNPIDPLVSIFIALLIAAGSWRLLREPFEVLMEAAPSELDVQEIGTAMASDPDVVEIHDLHVWTVTSGFPALSAHLVVQPGCDRDAVRLRMEGLLRRRFEVDHTTLQVVQPGPQDGLIQVENAG
jgi:cobalt-zinc-cadmium efflux system protein